MKYIPYEKLSKAKKRELDRKKRNTWNNVKPVTRVHKSAKDYSRKSKKNLTHILITDMHQTDFSEL